MGIIAFLVGSDLQMIFSVDMICGIQFSGWIFPEFIIFRFMEFIPLQALNEGIKSLNLKWNSIRGKGGVAIAASLSVSDFEHCSYPFTLV